MKKINKTLKNNEKAITLIALVITIIVLLILAGISIAMLSGENGILTRAGDAKTETEKANEKEQIQVEVLGSYSNSGKLEIATVNSNIKRNISGVTTDDATEFPLTVTYISTGNRYTVDEEGDVDIFRLANTTWQDNVNYTLDEQNHTLTLVSNDTSRTDIYNGDVIIKEKAVINEVEYTTKFPNDCSNLFTQASRMTSFSMEDIDTSNVRDMHQMFYACSALQNIDVSNLDTSNVRYMFQMFCDCSALQTLDLSSFNVEQVTNMGGMLYNVSAKLILNGWKIKKNDVISNYYGPLLFSGCKSSEIIANDWDVSNVNIFLGLFATCSSLKKLDISGWKFGTGCIAHGFFDGCTSLQTITGIDEWQLSNFNLNQAPFAAICQNCTTLGNKLTGGIWNNGTWSNGTFTPST